MPKERQVAASISTKSEAVGGGDHGKQSDTKSDSNECNLGETSKACESKESGAAAKGGGNEEENHKISKAASAKEKGESFSTITKQSPQMNGGEEEEEVQQGDERTPSLPPRATSARGNRADLQQRHESIQVPAVEEEGRGRRKTQPPNRLSYERLGGAANSTLTGSALMLGDEAEDESEECAFAFFSPVEIPGEPTNPKEAWEGPNGKEWKKASDEEMGSIIENDTFDLEETYMEQPEGYNDGSGRVWKLKKALYGLKQAPRQWYIKLREVLEAIGFTPSTADQSLFMLGEGEQRSFMVVYVDDILIFSPSSDLVKEVMLKLQDKFKCKTLEPEDMTSVGGFICCVGGGPTAWESKKQVDQALSSVESEYMALFRAIREVVWQRRLLAELGEEQQGPTPLYCDSQGAIALAKNPVLHGLTKHMKVKWH
ncbi:hypothetical protein CLOP_g25705 [Closterium sp. NIES-67]|nr:hypothetical protein CLOP_g25705 [Closterium sp. NIES-67]